MATSPTLSTSAASGGAAGAAIVLLQWGMGLFHVPLPADVAGAIMVLLTPMIHYVVARAGVSDPSAVATPEAKP